MGSKYFNGKDCQLISIKAFIQLSNSIYYTTYFCIYLHLFGTPTVILLGERSYQVVYGERNSKSRVSTIKVDIKYLKCLEIKFYNF